MIKRLVLAAAMVLGLDGAARAEEPEQWRRAMDAVANLDLRVQSDGMNTFALKLFARLRERKGNMFFSPYSVSAALRMTYIGAEGETEREMFKALDLPMGHVKQTEVLPWTKAEVAGAFWIRNDKVTTEHGASVRPEFELHMANALWCQQGAEFKKEFLGLVKDGFGGSAEPVDFAKSAAACKTINDWVAGQTKDKIKTLVPEGLLNANTRLVLTNAIYFMAPWQNKFHKTATRKGAFELAGGEKVQADMMRQAAHFRYAATKDVALLELPYKQSKSTMLFLLPTKRDGLAELEKSLDEKMLAGLLGALKDVRVDVTLPKFKFESEFALGDTLQAMGMKLAFDSAKADFSAMSEQEKLSVSAVIHKALVAVDEEGTEAAAATAVVAAAANGHTDKPETFVADHPFLIVIRGGGNVILFVGRVADPTK